MTRHDKTCDVLGPDIRASAQYIRPAKCNRIQGHEQLPDVDAHLHTERDPVTFKLRAWWTNPAVGKQPNRRKAK